MSSPEVLMSSQRCFPSRPGITLLLLLIGAIAVPLAPAEGHGQIGRRILDRARSAAEQEAANRVDRLVRDAIRCALGDARCAEQAKRDGKEVIYTDSSGEIITDKDGVPITDPEAAARMAGEQVPQRPGEGVWANYDFVPGDEILFYEDFSQDRVGDFPRRMEFVNGNWEVVDWQGSRLLRNTGPRYSALKILLPEALPERFTIEMEVAFAITNDLVALATAPPPSGRSINSGFQGHYIQLYPNGTGVVTRQRDGAESTSQARELADGLLPVRIMVDGRYAKVYVAERRVANIPNAEFQRSDELWLENLYQGSHERPLYFGSIRIAKGGLPLYDRLARDGRVATQGILFDVGSATLRPESTPTLAEIGDMLRTHATLRLRIEGHTDSDGDDDSNLELSQRRADAVRDFLVSTYGIAAGRLESAGFGESRPLMDNGTPEGKQQNRRVELVDLNDDGQ